MSEWLDYVKAYAEKNKITYKQATRTQTCVSLDTYFQDAAKQYI